MNSLGAIGAILAAAPASLSSFAFDPDDGLVIFRGYCIFAAAISAVLFVVGSRIVKERKGRSKDDHVATLDAPSKTNEEQPAFWPLLVSLVKRKSFLTYTIVNALQKYASDLSFTLFIYLYFAPVLFFHRRKNEYRFHIIGKI